MVVDNCKVSQNQKEWYQKARSALSQSFVANNLEMHRDSFLDINLESGVIWDLPKIWMLQKNRDPERSNESLQRIFQCFDVEVRSTTSGRDFISSLVPTWVERVPTSGAGARRFGWMNIWNQDFAVRNFDCLWFQAPSKSSRSVAIIALLNQMGSFVPCPESQDEWNIEASSWSFADVKITLHFSLKLSPCHAVSQHFSRLTVWFFHARSQCCPSMFWLHHVWKLRNVTLVNTFAC